MENAKPILTVSQNVESADYYVEIAAGSNAAETAFAIAVVAKCLARDGIIETDKFIEMISKYVDDPQYGIVEEGNENVQEHNN